MVNMKKTAITLALLLLVSFALAAVQLTSPFTVKFAAAKAAASPRTIIVPDDFSTIQEALGNATAGDMVYVRAGNYTIPPAWEYGMKIGPSVTIIGENPNTTIIATTEMASLVFGVGIGIVLYDDSEISGFTITGNDQVLGLFGNGRIINNIINLTANGRSAIVAGSGTISSNIINSAIQGVSAYSCGTFGIKTETTANTTISNNIINGFGVGIWVSGLLGQSKGVIFNNTLTNNNVGIEGVTPALLQGNNIVNSTDFALYAMFNITATYNWWGTTDAQKIAGSITTGLHTGVSVTFTPFLMEPNSQAMPVESSFAPPVLPSSALDVPYWAVAVVTILVSAAIIGIGLLLYFKKRKRKAEVT
jgi:hypothetical protein